MDPGKGNGNANMDPGKGNGSANMDPGKGNGNANMDLGKTDLYERTRWLMYVSVSIGCEGTTEEGGTQVDCDA